MQFNTTKLEGHMPFGTQSFLLRRILILLLWARFRFSEGLRERWEEASTAAGSDFQRFPDHLAPDP